jgi:hypothetical protein
LLHYFKAEMEPGTESLERAAQHYKSVLEEDRVQGYPFARAGVLFNLANVQRLVGQRKNDSALILDALENHAAACRDSLPYSPYWAFRAEEEATVDAEALKNGVDPSAYATALQKYNWLLALHIKHRGHRIGVAPFYVVVVAGTSGSKEPDWKAAPKRGDRIKDGTVVWENAGEFSYCEQCKQHLRPPSTDA